MYTYYLETERKALPLICMVSWIGQLWGIVHPTTTLPVTRMFIACVQEEMQPQAFSNHDARPRHSPSPHCPRAGIEQLALGPAVTFVPVVGALIGDDLGIVGDGVAAGRAGGRVVVAEPDGGFVLAGRDVAVGRAGARCALCRVAGAVLAVAEFLNRVVDP